MDSPYRSPPSQSPAGPARDTGLVGEVIDQFADPLALYRELVQNAIDAGTASIDVELSYDEGDQAAHIAVRDAGEGMDRDILENRLLVLFRSTKEQDSTKIGKFGIGFASVMSIRPRAVIVRTARGGHRFILHLYPDLNYELFDGGPATRSGTTVELIVPTEPGAMATLARDSEQALRRWCRHASVPIAFTARGPDGTTLVEARIDEPLAIGGALLQIDARSDDGATRVVVGLTRDSPPYTGFFNHGLTLQESDDALVGALRIKIQDSRLGHTISRDSVRRDDIYERAVELARKVATRQLPAAATAALHDAAQSDDLANYHALLEAMLRCGVPMDRDRWAIPLIEAVGGRDVVSLADLAGRPGWAARERSALTAALADAGVPVIDLRGQLPGSFAERLSQLRPVPTIDVHDELTLVTPVEPTGADLALIDALRAALEAARARAAAIQLCTLDGATAWVAVIHGDRNGERPWVVEREKAMRMPFTRLLARPLALNIGHRQVEAARAAAAHDPVAAGAMLARVVLLHYRRLDVPSSERILEHAVRELTSLR